MNKLLEERQERIRQLEQERLAQMSGAGASESQQIMHLQSQIAQLQRLLNQRAELSKPTDSHLMVGLRFTIR